MKQLTVPLIALLLSCLTQCKPANEQVVVPEAENNAEGPSTSIASPEQTLTLYTWDEYFSPEVLSDFTKITGIQVTIDTFEDTDEIEQTVRSHPGKHDVIIFDRDRVDKFRELKLLTKLDRNQLPHFSNLEAKHTNLEIDPGNRYSVPYLWGTTLIAYRKDKIPEPERSWSILWDPALKGRIGMLNERLETLGVALLRNGLSINDRTVEGLSLAQSSLLDQTNNLGVHYIEGAPSALQDALGSGKVWATMAYSGDAAMIAQEDDNIGYFIPEEGCTMWMDNFVIARDSQHLVEAHAFIDFMLTGPAAARNANFLRYATPNTAAAPHLDKDMLENEGIYPPEATLAKCEFAGRLAPERERPANDVWKAVIESTAIQSKAVVTEAFEEDSE